MTTQTDKDLSLMLYRSWVVMKIRLSEDREDLDRRFDKMMNEIDSERDPQLLFTVKRCIGAGCRRHLRTVRRLVRTQVLKAGILGAGAAAAGGYLTMKVEGALTLVVPLAGLAILTAGTMLKPPRALRRRGRAAERDSVPSPASQ